MYPTIMAKFRKGQLVYLSEEKIPLDLAIRVYAARRLVIAYERFQQLELRSHEIGEIE